MPLNWVPAVGPTEETHPARRQNPPDLGNEEAFVRDVLVHLGADDHVHAAVRDGQPLSIPAHEDQAPGIPGRHVCEVVRVVLDGHHRPQRRGKKCGNAPRRTANVKADRLRQITTQRVTQDGRYLGCLAANIRRIAQDVLVGIVALTRSR